MIPLPVEGDILNVHMTLLVCMVNNFWIYFKAGVVLFGAFTISFLHILIVMVFLIPSIVIRGNGLLAWR